MTHSREDASNPSRRAVLGAGSALLGANLASVAAAPAVAELAQLALPATAPQTPPPGYNVLFLFVDQEHFLREMALSGTGKGISEEERHYFPQSPNCGAGVLIGAVDRLRRSAHPTYGRL